MGEDTTRTKTEYVILRRNDVIGETAAGTQERWERVAAVEAHSGDAAKRAYAEKQAGEPDAWASALLVAVPARSWEPTPVTINKRVVVTLGDA